MKRTLRMAAAVLLAVNLLEKHPNNWRRTWHLK